MVLATVHSLPDCRCCASALLVTYLHQVPQQRGNCSPLACLRFCTSTPPSNQWAPQAARQRLRGLMTAGPAAASQPATPAWVLLQACRPDQHAVKPSRSAALPAGDQTQPGLVCCAGMQSCVLLVHLVIAPILKRVGTAPRCLCRVPCCLTHAHPPCRRLLLQSQTHLMLQCLQHH